MRGKNMRVRPASSAGLPPKLYRETSVLKDRTVTEEARYENID
jgi:hypothetical protein